MYTVVNHFHFRASVTTDATREARRDAMREARRDATPLLAAGTERSLGEVIVSASTDA